MQVLPRMENDIQLSDIVQFTERVAMSAIFHYDYKTKRWSSDPTLDNGLLLFQRWRIIPLKLFCIPGILCLIVCRIL